MDGLALDPVTDDVVCYCPQVMEMFIIVLHQCHKESDDKWKRLSRQVTDMVLPLLAKQQVRS